MCRCGKSFAVWRRRQIRRSLCCAGGLGWRSDGLQVVRPGSIGRTVRGSFASSSAFSRADEPRPFEAEVLELRDQHPVWGGRKLAGPCLLALGRQAVPAASTITAILRRHAVASSRRSHFWRAPVQRFERERAQRAVADGFQGRFPHEFDGRRCHPLTITDDQSRYSAWGLRACLNQRSGVTVPGESAGRLSTLRPSPGRC